MFRFNHQCQLNCQPAKHDAQYDQTNQNTEQASSQAFMHHMISKIKLELMS